MNEMVERVAKALEPHLDGPFEMTRGEIQEIARVAIEAMRERTEAMVDASDAAWKNLLGSLYCNSPLRVPAQSLMWRAQIDAALNA